MFNRSWGHSFEHRNRLAHLTERFGSMLKRHYTIAAALSSIAAAGLCPVAKADPCQPGANSASQSNTCLGYSALGQNGTGNNNTAFGVYALEKNTSGNSNTALGNNTLKQNSSGSDNTANGMAALESNVTGSNNTAIGGEALRSNVSGSNNTAIGYQALVKNIASDGNTAVGEGSLWANGTGSNNTAIGLGSLRANGTGNNNTALGMGALQNNSSGANNTASGAGALNSNVSGSSNTASGVTALGRNTNGNNNTASGMNALYKPEEGNNNVASGFEAGLNLGYNVSNNILLGFRAGKDIATAYQDNNIFIGNQSGLYDRDTIRIGTQGTQTRAFIAGISGAGILNGQQVVVNSSGQLGVVLSSQRYKEDIQPMGDISDALMRLRPVTFRYKQAAVDGSKPVQYGLIAEEVEQVMPELVTHNKDGSLQSVAYHVLPSLLLSEYQKQGRELIETKARIASMRAKLAVLKESVNQLEASNP